MTHTAFTPTRAAGIERLREFLPRAGSLYASHRNTDFGPDDRANVSGLSPYVRHRLVTEEEVIGSAIAAHGLSGADKFIQELLAHLLEGLAGTAARRLGRLDRGTGPGASASGQRSAPCRWVWAGRGGANGHRLLRRLGRRTDGNGLSAQSRPDVVRQHLDLYAPVDLTPPDPGSRTGLLVHEEDLHPESLLLSVRLEAVAVCPAGRLPGTSPAVTAWVTSVLDDAGKRAGRQWGLEPRMLPPADWIAAATDWARAADLQQVVTPFAPVGPTADRMRLLAEVLAVQGIRVVQVRRPYDDLCWPHATRGFFAFKKMIPDLVHSLGTAGPDGLGFADREHGL